MQSVAYHLAARPLGPLITIPKEILPLRVLRGPIFYVQISLKDFLESI
jgi:hypothetical protein